MDTVTINGEDYISVKDFAKAVNKSYPTIYHLAKYGSRSGFQLKSIMFKNLLLIPVTEIKNMKKNMPSVGRPREKV